MSNFISFLLSYTHSFAATVTLYPVDRPAQWPHRLSQNHPCRKKFFSFLPSSSRSSAVPINPRTRVTGLYRPFRPWSSSLTPSILVVPEAVARSPALSSSKPEIGIGANTNPLLSGLFFSLLQCKQYCVNACNQQFRLICCPNDRRFQTQVKALRLVYQCAHTYTIHPCLCIGFDIVQVNTATGFRFYFPVNDLQASASCCGLKLSSMMRSTLP